MATKYAFKMTTREGTYFVDSETGEFIDDVTGYEVLSFGPEVDELPDLEDIQEETSAKSGLGGEEISPEQKELMRPSGSGDTMSRRTPRDDTLRSMHDNRQDMTKADTRAGKLATKAGGLLGGKVVGGIGAAIGMGVAGPLGAVAGGLLGNLAGAKLGGGIVTDMRTNPQTMALPGKTTKPGPSRVAVPRNAPRSNPLMAPRSPVERAPLGPTGTQTRVNPVPASSPPSVNLNVSPLTYEDVDFPPIQEKAPFTQPQRPVTPTPISTKALFEQARPAVRDYIYSTLPERIQKLVDENQIAIAPVSAIPMTVEEAKKAVQPIVREQLPAKVDQLMRENNLTLVPAAVVQPQRPVTPTPISSRMTPEEAERMAQSLPDIQLTEQQMAAFRDRMPARRSNPLMAQPARPAPRHNLPAAPVSPVTRAPMPSISPLPGVPVSGVARGVPLANVDPLTASPVGDVTRGVPLADVSPLGTSPVGRVTRGSPLADVGPLNAMPVGRVDRGFAPGSLSPLTASPVSQVGRSALAPVAPSFNQPMNPANRAAPTYSQTPEGRNVPAPTLASRTPRSNPLFAGSRVTTDTAMVNPMTRTQSRQVLPTLDYDRFSRTKAPSVNWGDINPDQLDPYTRGKVEEAQSKLGFSLNVTSGFRDREHNAKVGGAKNSSHISSRAVDIGLKGLSDSQRTDVVAAFGSVSDPGKGRIGAYSGNTALHYDTTEKLGAYAYGGVHGMFNSTDTQLHKAPGWFTDGLRAVKDKDFSRLNAQAPRDPFSYENMMATTTPPTPQARERQTPTPSAYSNTPGAYTSSGMFNRDQKTKEQMGFTIAGELDGRTLRGLERNDPVARAELANVVATMENRAFSSTYKGDMNAVNIPSQYNSLMDSEIGVTRANWGAYGSTITKAIDDYYTGQNKPTMPQATHYANYDTVKPDWDAYATERQKVGYHTFSTVNLKDMDVQQYAPTKAFQEQFDKAIRDEVNKQTQVSFDIGRTAVNPTTPKPTNISSTMTTGYPTVTRAALPDVKIDRPFENVAQKAIDDAKAAEEAKKDAETKSVFSPDDPWGGTRETKGVMGAAKDAGPVGVSRTLDALGRSSGAVSRNQMDSLGVSRGYSGGMTMTDDRGNVSYSRANGSTTNPDGTSYDPWGGMRSGVMGGGSSRGGGIGPGGSGPSDPSR